MYCYTLLIGLTLLTFGVACSRADDTTEPSPPLEPEPAFPGLIDSAIGARIHITSESFDANYGYETIEEYVDFDIGKATYTSSTKQGHRTTFIDSSTQTIYRYKPYSCLMLKQSELISTGETGVWSKLVNNLHLFEVAAVWMNAADMPKVYSKSSVVYSSGKDMFRPAHKWTIKNGSNGLVHLFFIEDSINSKTTNDDTSQPQLSLEMIQEELDGKIKRTINVLSIDYYIPVDIYETLLQVPLGYGCKPDNKPADFETKQALINAPDRVKPNRLRMEATATNFVGSASASTSQKQSTDTVSVDLVVKSFKKMESFVQMVRQRNSHNDVKVITDYLTNVQYSIDLRRGACSMGHAKATDADQDKFAVEFTNGLQMGFDWPILMELFSANPSWCQVIKVTNQGRPVEFVFEECKADKIFASRKPARVMRKYSLRRDEPQSLNLESVTVWVMDSEMNANAILESYHFYVIESDVITDALELVRLFDVSEECYLNSDQMRYGRDYAWVEFTYPMASHDLDKMASHSHQLKERIQQQFKLFFDSLIRMPRVETMFTETGIVLRLLLLNEPSLVHRWDSFGQMTLDPTSDALITETTVDAEHCADLCNLHGCQAMSYCSNNYACSMRSSGVRLAKLANEMKRAADCTVYAPVTERDAAFGKRTSENLHFVLGRLQHEDLSEIELPKMPDELLYPQSMTGLSNHDLMKKQSEYLASVYKKLEELDRYLPLLTMMFVLDGGSMLLMVPSKFEIEGDPLAEFALDNNAESLEDNADLLDQSSAAAAFHEGLPMYRYRLSAFRDASQPLDAHQYVGLNYDQCALACADGRCGSFSYCKHRQECVLTNVYNLEEAKQSGDQIVQDSDCFIAQRDFLSKFNQFANVKRPPVYKRQAPAHNPTECAHSCVVESSFNCLAFDYCQATEQTGAQCFYSDSRAIFTGSVAPAPVPATTADKRPAEPTGCSHYSRSFLAEFTRIAYREVVQEQLAQLKTTVFGAKSVDQCAEICLNELMDCTAFQFCFSADAKVDKPRQQCTMIESRPRGKEAAREFRLVQDAEGNILEQGKFFSSSIDCHVFALRHDTVEAQMRDVALEPLSPAEAKARTKTQSGGGGMSLGGALLLYLSATVVFAAIGSGLVLLKHHSPYVSERYDRVMARFGYY